LYTIDVVLHEHLSLHQATVARHPGAREYQGFRGLCERAVVAQSCTPFDVENIHTSPLGRALTANHALHDQPLG
jgi:hypothetical protein